MSQNEIHVEDKGTTFTVTLYDGSSVVDISAVESIYFKFKKPDSTIHTATATLTTSGTDGVSEFTVNTTTILDQDGTWMLQAVFNFSTTSYSSDIYEFRVYPNLE